jgi:hypothetical protein
MQVHHETYRQEEDFAFTDKNGREHRGERYSVEITIRGDRRRVVCGDIYQDSFRIYGLAVRFQNGEKVWRGEATYLISKNKVINLLPCIDKRGQFSLVGYFKDFDGKKIISQHNAM